MKRCRLILPLILALALALTGCTGSAAVEQGRSDTSAEASGAAAQTSVSVETVEPYPYGGPIEADGETLQAAEFAAGIISGNLRWELPSFRSFRELQNEHADAVLGLLAAHESEMRNAGGRIVDLTVLAGYDADEAAGAVSDARYYTFEAAEAVLSSLFGTEEAPDWETMAAELPSRILPNTGVVCIQALGKAEAETHVLAVGYAAEEDGWVFQFVEAVLRDGSEDWQDCTTGETIGHPEGDETLDEYLTERLPSLGLITATVGRNADGTFRLERLEGAVTSDSLAAEEE